MEFFGVLPHSTSLRVRMTARAGGGDDSGGERSGDEEEFAGGFAGFEVAVGVGGVGEWVDVLEGEFEGVWVEMFWRLG